MRLDNYANLALIDEEYNDWINTCFTERCILKLSLEGKALTKGRMNQTSWYETNTYITELTKSKTIINIVDGEQIGSKPPTPTMQR